MEKCFIGFDALDTLARKQAEEICKVISYKDALKGLRIYPVPRGGVSAALAMMKHIPQVFQPVTLTDNVEDAHIVVDDLVDSGRTKREYLCKLKPFFSLIDKRDKEYRGKWIVFPWESSQERDMADHVVRLLEHLGEDPTRGGLVETPERVAKAWAFWTSGNGKDPKDVLKTFEDGAEKHDQMITVANIPLYSHCEHHMAAIFGTATISYIPNGKIVGLSKLSRLVDIFARRLQVQERMTDQIADALFQHLEPKGVGVAIKARHLCMESRGICQQGHHTMTTALRGAIKDLPEARAEFLRLV